MKKMLIFFVILFLMSNIRAENITIMSPDNNTIINDSSVNITAYLESEENMSCDIYLNNKTIKTIQFEANNTTEFEIYFLTNGQKNITVKCETDQDTLSLVVNNFTSVIETDNFLTYYISEFWMQYLDILFILFTLAISYMFGKTWDAILIASGLMSIIVGLFFITSEILIPLGIGLLIIGMVIKVGG